MLDGRAWTVAEIARRTGLPRGEVEQAVGTLLAERALVAERHGPHRYVRLGVPSRALLATARGLVLPEPPPPGPREPALRFARTCHGHLAGRLGVALTEGLLHRGALLMTEAGLLPGPDALGVLQAMGILPHERVPVAALPGVRACLDWSERRWHLGGQLGLALARHAQARGWIRLVEGRRVLVTRAGEEAFARLFGVCIF